MKKEIWKYDVLPGTQHLEMPIGAMILSCHVQRDKVCLWAMVDPKAEKGIRVIEVYGTGDTIIDPDRLVFIDTILLHGGSLVFHIFEAV